jgi:hypothetical protein
MSEGFAPLRRTPPDVPLRLLEGIHLRGGRVARDGIRWSDRDDDFRTEILGLMIPDPRHSRQEAGEVARARANVRGRLTV